MSGQFVHLHVHTEKSINDGLSKVSELVDRAVELGMPAMAVTEHGNMFSAVDFYKACKKKGIKPIIGCEVYVCPTGKEDKIRDNRHLVLLCKNETGYKNLVKITSDAWVNGKYYNPRTDYDFLSKHSEGLIALTACLGGDISREYFEVLEGAISPFKTLSQDQLQNVKEEAYKKCIDKLGVYIEIFGRDNLYLEVQDNGIKEQYEWNEVIYRLSEDTGLPVVCTNDCHYVYKEDFTAHDAVMALQTGAKLKDKKRRRYDTDQLYVKSYDELNQGRVPQSSLDITLEIADRCNFEFEFGHYHIPTFDQPEEFETSEDYLDYLIEEGMKKRYPDNYDDPELTDRVNYELSVVRRMGYNDYFLDTWDYVNFCKENGILVGPGRGCFTSDNYVLMSNGKTKKIKDIKIGDKIITHKGNIKTVLNTLKYDIKENITHLKPSGMNTIKCTNDHRILAIKTHDCLVSGTKLGTHCSKKCHRFDHCSKRKENQFYEPSWIEANNLNRGDFLVYPKPKLKEFDKNLTLDLTDYDENLKYDDHSVWYEIGSNHLKTRPIKRFIKIDNLELIKLFGIYIGNGYSSIKKNHSYCTGIAFPAHKYKDLQFCKRILESVLGDIKSHEKWNKKRTCVSLEISCKPIAIMFKQLFGESAKYKKVPDFLITNNQEVVKALIEGLMETDGSMPTNYDFKLKYSSISYNLISQIKLLFASIGYYATINERVHKKHTNWNNEYSLTISGKQLLRLKEDIFPDMICKQQRYFRNEFYEDEENFYFKIQQKTNHKYEGEVYDLTIEDDSSFMINNCAVHNSGAGSIVCYAIGITDVDPIRFDLLFERFLNPDRASMPD